MNNKMKWEDLFEILSVAFKIPKQSMVLKIGESAFEYEPSKEKKIKFGDVNKPGTRNAITLVDLIDKKKFELQLNGLLKIIAKQSSQGCWKYDLEFVEWLLDLGLIDKKDEFEQTDASLTRVVLKVLASSFGKDEGKWKLIARKSTIWLQRNNY